MDYIKMNLMEKIWSRFCATQGCPTRPFKGKSLFLSKYLTTPRLINTPQAFYRVWSVHLPGIRKSRTWKDKSPPGGNHGRIIILVLIPQKKVLKASSRHRNAVPWIPSQAPNKKLLRLMMQSTDVWLQWDTSGLEPLILHCLWRKPRKIILLANTSKSSRLGWKDSWTLRCEHRFNFPVFQYQIFFTKTLTYFIKTFRAPQRKSTKLKLNHHYFHRKWIWAFTMYFCACKNG